MPKVFSNNLLSLRCTNTTSEEVDTWLERVRRKISFVYNIIIIITSRCMSYEHVKHIVNSESDTPLLRDCRLFNTGAFSSVHYSV